jgi:hypothetical protein
MPHAAQMVLAYARELQASLRSSHEEAAVAQQEAEEGRVRSLQQMQALEAAQRKIRALEHRNAELLEEQTAMIFKYRRCACIHLGSGTAAL